MNHFFASAKFSKNYGNYLAHSSLRSQKRGMWFIFRALPEK
ncbi:MAG: hypothetical protein U5L45_20125 [Saprospiraceae bacterium]|nr:hypothetical protein [Saprospiraceae bacterium]